MIITFTILAIIFYLRHKVKAIWNKGQCKYIIGSIGVLICTIYLYTSQYKYPLRSFPFRETEDKDRNYSVQLFQLQHVSTTDPTAVSVKDVNSQQGPKTPKKTSIPSRPSVNIPTSYMSTSTPSSTVDSNYHNSSTLSTTKSISKSPMGCLIPILTPFDSSVQRSTDNKRSIKTTYSRTCSDNDLPLMFETDLYSNLVRMNKDSNTTWTDCFYRYVTTNESMDDLNFEPHSLLGTLTFSNKSFSINHDTVKIPPEHEFIGIFCHRAARPTHLKPHLIDVLAFVHENPLVETKMSNIKLDDGATNSSSKDELEDKEQISVHLVMLDNISHMSFLRSFNQTYEYIMRNLNTFDLNGLSVTNDEPAFESFSALLTGKPTKDQVKQNKITTSASEKAGDSEEPYIWQKFASKGYYTALVEDCPAFFNSKTKRFAFSKQPTDYYPKPLFDLLKKIKNPNSSKVSHQDYHENCYGPRPRFQVLMDYWRSLVNLGDNNRKYFMALAVCGLIEDKINQAKVDVNLVEQLMWLKGYDILNQSAVFLIGNQGVKAESKDFMKTNYGSLEFRMPAGFIILPDWFRIKYPLAVTNLLKNRRALVTHLDIYETILSLSDLNNLRDQRILERTKDFQRNQEYLRGISLFLPIPKSRDCDAAEIDEDVCTCLKNPFELSPEHNAVNSSIAYVLDEINEKLKNFSQCSVLAVSKVHWAILQSAEDKSKEPNRDEIQKLQQGDNEMATLHLSFSSIPGNRTFEAVVRGQGSDKWILLGDVSLTGHYNNHQDQDCVLREELFNPVLDNLCYCK